MNIGIIVAMDKELQLLLPLLSDSRQTTINGVTFHLGDVAGSSVVAMKSGIGKVNAALAASEMIKQFAPDLVINTGVAGGTGSEAKILDVVVAERIAYHDVWCGPGTHPGQAARCPLYFTPGEELLQCKAVAKSDRVRHGLIASGDIFVSRPEDIARIKAMYPEVMAVDMESAAIAQTCHLLGTPFFAIRVVSDTPGEHDDNAAQYDNFWEAAPRQTFEILERLLTELSQPADEAESV